MMAAPDVLRRFTEPFTRPTGNPEDDIHDASRAALWPAGADLCQKSGIQAPSRE
jgi:hypothetical protein